MILEKRPHLLLRGIGRLRIAGPASRGLGVKQVGHILELERDVVLGHVVVIVKRKPSGYKRAEHVVARALHQQVLLAGVHAFKRADRVIGRRPCPQKHASVIATRLRQRVGVLRKHVLRHLVRPARKRPLVGIEIKDGVVHFTQLEDSRDSNANMGTQRALVNDMVKGVTVGFEKKLTLVGVGYRAQAQGDKLNLQVGFSHPVVHQMPAGVKVATPSQTEIVISGADKQKVGQTAAVVRGYRAPEPYKGKGIRYADEHVVIKETKKK